MQKKLAIAVDLGATNVRVALVSEDEKILTKLKDRTKKTGKSSVIVVRQIMEMIGVLLKEQNIKNISGIGISSIGPLDLKKGRIMKSPNFPFEFTSLLLPLKNKFSLPVLLLNDGRAAVLGERYFGVGKNSENLVYITISSGIGGGAIVNGNLLLGKDGNAGEIGHMNIDTKYDFPCSCGRGFGHWEACASGENLPKFFSFWLNKNNLKAGFEFANAKDIFDAARLGNKIAQKFIFDEIGKINAKAISNIIAVYNPELITIGGSVALNNKDLILPPIMKYLDHYLKTPKIKITSLGDNAGLLGAASSVFVNF